MAMAERDGGVYLSPMAAEEDDHDSLREAVFVPAVRAFEPIVFDQTTTQIDDHAYAHQVTHSGAKTLGTATKPGVRPACTGSHDGQCQWFRARSINPVVETSRQ